MKLVTVFLPAILSFLVFMNHSFAGCGIGTCNSNTIRKVNFLGVEISYSTDAQCNIERFCENIIGAVEGLTRDAFEEIGRNFPSAHNELLNRANGYRRLTLLEKAALSCHFPDLELERVKLYFDVTMLDKIEAFGGTHRIYWVESEAQTMGYDIFFSGKESNYDREDFMASLVHELVHTHQFVHYGESLSRFGAEYMGGLYDAGGSYDENIFEKYAVQVQNNLGITPCSEDTSNTITAAIKLSNREYLCVSHFDDNVEHYVMKTEPSPSEDNCIWHVAPHCIKSPNIDGYLGETGGDKRWVSLATQCYDSAKWGFRKCEGSCTYSGFLKHAISGKTLNIAENGFAEFSSEFGNTYKLEYFTSGSLNDGSGSSGFNLVGDSNDLPFANSICSGQNCQETEFGAISLDPDDWSDLKNPAPTSKPALPPSSDESDEDIFNFPTNSPTKFPSSFPGAQSEDGPNYTSYVLPGAIVACALVGGCCLYKHICGNGNNSENTPANDNDPV
ncbi:MAG: hypothetical protein AB8G05_27065 [Oligoflexales bacterium]